ncbi:MAG: hypothetical protein GX621_09150, partial [Pirellulaceae bacterium]|nr:hypothetical protein [Pirellulaceae bacterium]
MALLILRLILIMVASAIGVSLIKSNVVPVDNVLMLWTAPLGMIALALTLIAGDILIRRKQLDVISSVYFGLIVGMFLAYVAGLALTPVLPDNRDVRNIVN